MLPARYDDDDDEKDPGIAKLLLQQSMKRYSSKSLVICHQFKIGLVTK